MSCGGVCRTGITRLHLGEERAGIREQLSDLLSELEPWLRAGAIAYEARGFKATIARSVITSIHLASRARFPSRVFQRVDEAVTWLEETTGSSGLHAHPQLQRYLTNT